jgi:hypothetical protein
LTLLKKLVAVESSFFTLPRAPRICMTRAVDCVAKLPSRISQASYEVVARTTIPITPSKREETIAERMDWSC